MGSDVYCEGFLRLPETLRAADEMGLRLDQYLEQLWCCSGQAKRVIADIQARCPLPGRPVILEIGPGSGRFLHQTVIAFNPVRYDIYEPADEWSRWLAKEYSEVTAHEADGRSLSATPDGSCDLVVAHGVFVYLKMLCSFEYFIEIGRVCRPGAFAVFDVFTERSFDVAHVREWLDCPERFPAVIPESSMLGICEQEGLRLISTFSRRLGAGESWYYVLQKR
jgi:SAM-dependent methyltransferase